MKQTQGVSHWSRKKWTRSEDFVLCIPRYVLVISLAFCTKLYCFFFLRAISSLYVIVAVSNHSVKDFSLTVISTETRTDWNYH